MKPTFFNIDETKRTHIINSCINEFAENGYEKSSTDRIIKKAKISKGGLYEYISSKEELFLFTVEYVYKKLYGYISDEMKKQKNSFPDDILLRFNTVATIAIDFYIEHPEYIKFISNTYRQHNQALEEKVHKIFMKQFMGIFGEIKKENLSYDKDRLIDMLIWLLAKTRDDFLHAIKKNISIKKIKTIYLENWDFYLSVLKTGIYNK